MNSRPSIGELITRVQRNGFGDLSRRLVRRLYTHLDAGSLDFPLLAEDIADSNRLVRGDGAPQATGNGPLTIGWVCTPPSPGSGGHTTLFRMIAGVAAAGHRSVLFLYDRHSGDHQRHADVITENWPWLQVEIRDATEGIFGVDACVASSWETAHVLASRTRQPVSSFYFIQDFEPYFYPRGSMQALAEDSYRFGFTNIALGEMVARELVERGIECVVAPFGCDTATYSRTDSRKRSGVVFYTKPSVDRRGYLLGKLALHEFHLRHPEQPIHVYGDSADSWSVPIVRHERLTPAGLNVLYNESVAGLAMSFTNISLVAEEMLAAGTIPIVNDSSYSRADLPNDNVEWALPTPGGIADALCRVVEDPQLAQRSAAASTSVRRGWGPAEDVVTATIQRVVRLQATR